MESVLSGGEDFLLPGLSYDLAGDQASYIVSKRFSQISSNVPVAGPQAVKQISFNIADPSGFLDLSSCVLVGPSSITMQQNRCNP